MAETPRLEVGISQEKAYSVPLPSVTHNGFLYKTPSMAKPLGERKGTEGRWRAGRGRRMRRRKPEVVLRSLVQPPWSWTLAKPAGRLAPKGGHHSRWGWVRLG